MTFRRNLAPLAALALAAGLMSAAAAPALATAPVKQSVIIDNFNFGPMTITVPVGSTVTWTNRDDIPHTVRAVDGSFHSTPLDSGDSYSFVFAKPGVYSYFCSIHPKMVAQIVVKGP